MRLFVIRERKKKYNKYKRRKKKRRIKRNLGIRKSNGKQSLTCIQKKKTEYLNNENLLKSIEEKKTINYKRKRELVRTVSKQNRFN